MTDYKQPPSHEENWTALLSCFLRAHHARRRAGWVLDDNLAEALLGGEQYREIAACLAHGAAPCCSITRPVRPAREPTAQARWRPPPVSPCRHPIPSGN